MEADVVVAADAVDDAFLTGCLRRAGHDVTVVGFEAQPVGTGQIGECIRYTLQVEGELDGCPRSLVGKFPSPDEASRATGVALQNYLKEVRFYENLQREVTISTPRCYHAAIDGVGPEFTLILEDMAPAVQGDQLQGCSEAEARSAVEALVGLHGPSWNQDRFHQVPWLRREPEPGAPGARELYGQLLTPFFDRFRDRLAPDEAAIIERVAASEGAPWYPPADPLSLVHIDYRLDNLLFDHRSDPPLVTAVDWQSIGVGPPLNDVAYFIGAGLLPEVRPSVEEGLVRGYHRALEEAGVEGYGWDRCWEDYRRGSFHGFTITVIASTIVVETERGNDMFTAMARRHARHALDLGAGEFL